MRRFLIRKAYRAAFLGIMAWRQVTGRRGRGGMVAVWCRSRVLLVKPSYAPFYTFPGGRAEKGETLRDAAVRELAEETGIVMTGNQLTAVDHPMLRQLREADILGVYEVTVSNMPDVEIDGIEIEDFCFVTVAEAKKMNIYNKARYYLYEMPDGHQ